MLDMLKGNLMKLVLAIIIAIVLTKLLSPIIVLVGWLITFVIVVLSSYFGLLFLKRKYDLNWLK